MANQKTGKITSPPSPESRSQAPNKSTATTGDQNNNYQKPKQKQLGKTKKAVEYRKRKVLSAILEGKTLAEAGKIAGYSDSSAAEKACKIANNQQNQRTFNAILDAAGVTDEFLSKRIRELSTAKETKFFAHQGVVIDEREVEALGIQDSIIQFATKVKGHLVDKVQLDLDPITAALESGED